MLEHARHIWDASDNIMKQIGARTIDEAIETLKARMEAQSA